MINVPFNKPSLLGRETEYVSQVLADGGLAGGHSYGKRSQSFLQDVMGVPKALLTPSCTHALEMCSLLLRFGPGDEVILPSFTFVSTANAFAVHGGRPVFCDIRPDTLNLDEAKIEELINPRTKAIVPVHYAGIGCEMDAIMEIAGRHGVPVLEDNAHGLFGRYRGKALGTFGALSTLSFHETKNLTCGEGGALIINDTSFIERAEIIRDKGTDRSRFFRGQVDKYTWRDVGSSYQLSDILAAVLLGQLEEWPTIQEKRKAIWDRYFRDLLDWAKKQGVGLPHVPQHCEQAYHLFFLLCPSTKARESLIDHLRGRGVQAVFHYQPLHRSAMGESFGGRPGECPVTEDVSGRLLRLPFFHSMTDSDLDQVIQSLHEWSWA